MSLKIAPVSTTKHLYVDDGSRLFSVELQVTENGSCSKWFARVEHDGRVMLNYGSEWTEAKALKAAKAKALNAIEQWAHKVAVGDLYL